MCVIAQLVIGGRGTSCGDAAAEACLAIIDPEGVDAKNQLEGLGLDRHAAFELPASQHIAGRCAPVPDHMITGDFFADFPVLAHGRRSSSATVSTTLL